MVKLREISIVLIILGLAFTCKFVSIEDYQRIQPGMNRATVLRALGEGKKPSDKKFEGGKEIWYFDLPAYDGYQSKKVVFVNDRVAEMGDAPARTKAINAQIKARQEREKAEAAASKLYGQQCDNSYTHRKSCPNARQVCRTSDYYGKTGVCTIRCSNNGDCTGIGDAWLSCKYGYCAP